jgi:cellulose synthase/poly-beta-1,6-N-acetylglucosamine synthase-like glycosyltransferase
MPHRRELRAVTGALRALVEPFADASVGVVSGAKVVRGPGARGGGEGLYWRLEAFLKDSESAFGATMGAPGEICGLRRAAFRPIPPQVINDDYHVTCDALVRGWRVRYAEGARAVEAVSAAVGDEFERRTRIAAGTWQTTLMHLRLAHPRRGWTAVAFVSHRVLRSMVVPLLLPPLAVGSAIAARSSRSARVVFIGQAGAYGLAALGALVDQRITAVPYQFALTNIATLRGGARLATRRQQPMWRRVARGEWTSGS